MRGETEIGLREAREQPVVEHRARTEQRLLCGLPDQHHRARPAIAQSGERLRDANQIGDVRVVTARVHHGHIPALIGRACLARPEASPVFSSIGSASMSARTRMRGALAIFEHADDAGAADFFGHG